MVFIQQESAGRSGEPSRLRDKLLLLNARTRLSQQGVASFVGVSTAALRNWEAGQSKPTAQNLKRLIELYVAYRAFAEGEEQTEAADLWEAAQERGLKVPFDQQWFQGLLANQRNSHRESERERQPEQQYEPGQELEQVHTQEGHEEASDDRSSTENGSDLLTQAPEKFPSSTYKLSRRTVVVSLACLVAGGAVGSSLTWMALRPQTSLLPQAKWTQTGNMFLARGFFRATLLPNGQVLIEGGVLKDQSLRLTTQSELFDPTKGTFHKTQGGLNEARAKHTATLLPNGKVLVTGGYGPLQSAEIYDPKTDTWRYTSNQMNYPRARHTATLLQSGKVLIAGGMPDNTTELYEPGSDTWSSSGNMSTRRYDHVAVHLLDGTVLVAGGRTRSNNKNITKDNPSITNSTDLYNPKTNTWSPLPNMYFPRAEFTTALLSDGRVLVIGGQLPNGDVTPTTEIYDPYITKSWQQGPGLNYARLNPLGQGALQFEDGTIMVVGGDSQGTSERYIPTTGKWVSVLSLHSQHYLGASCALNNGQALVAGGFVVLSSDDKSKLTVSAEIYTPGSE